VAGSLCLKANTMTQPTSEGAVEGANDTVVPAAEPTIDDRLLAALTQEEGGEPEVETDQPEPTEDGEGEPELTEEDVAEEVEADQPSIAAPVSWTAEEKEEFSKLPRTVQETLTRREAEREKFVQSKAQEAAQVRQQVERQALTELQGIQKAAAERLAHFAQMLTPNEPDIRLLQSGNEDDRTYYFQQEASYRQWSAQQQQAQRQADEARQMAEQAERALQAQEQAEFVSTLQEHFPEYLEPTSAKLREELGSIARELGYPAELLREANASDIIALKRASDWKAKAAKYDTLMAKKMEKVREAKALPKVSKPGVAQGKGAIEGSRYAADREAMKRGDKQAEMRVLERFLT
jgi:hypothetical protein